MAAGRRVNQVKESPNVVSAFPRQEAGLRLAAAHRDAYPAAVRGPGRRPDQGLEDQVRGRYIRTDEPEPGAVRAERAALRPLEALLHADQLAPGRAGLQWRRVRRAGRVDPVGQAAGMGARTRGHP
ncbi:hypothetical protein G6F57_020540 [Rhizopus arrhizus]|nr:hypothetical protein G6F57_020540 [Rhizopus arrhizus]